MAECKPDLIIRPEIEQDYRRVEELTREAFWDIHVPGCGEHFILHNLRNSPDFIPELDLVAQIGTQIVGHIVYSRAVIRSGDNAEHAVVCFGPVSVRPELQKQGIGKALITHSLEAARSLGYPAVLIYGDPRYYGRFGFRCAERYEIKTPDDKYACALLARELQPGALEKRAGRFFESPAFEIDEEQFALFDRSFPVREKSVTDSQREFSLLVSLRY